MNAVVRTARIERQTRETVLQLDLRLDGCGAAQIETGLGFLDHMLMTLARFARFDLSLKCTGDLHVDDHHTVEDCALGLGQALNEALGPARAGVARFGWAYAPLDEALARAVVDLVTRPVAVIDLGLRRERLGVVACENLAHFFRSLAAAGRFTLHLDVLRGDNDHHRVEAAFKAAALALRAAVAPDELAGVPSTKGVM